MPESFSPRVKDLCAVGRPARPHLEVWVIRDSYEIAAADEADMNVVMGRHDLRRKQPIDTGAYGKSPVMQEVRDKAKRSRVKLLILPTTEAIKILNEDPNDTNAILHVTC